MANATTLRAKVEGFLDGDRGVGWAKSRVGSRTLVVRKSPMLKVRMTLEVGHGRALMGEVEMAR